MIRCSKLSSTGGKTCKGAPNQHAKPTGLGKQASRSLHSAHAKTRRKEGSACPPWQATRLHLHLPNRKRRNRARAMGGRGHCCPRSARRRSTRGSNAGTTRWQEGGKRNAGSERSDGPRRNRSWPPEPPGPRRRRIAHLGVRGSGRCCRGGGARLVHLHRVRGAGGVGPTRQRGHVEGGAAGGDDAEMEPPLSPLSSLSSVRRLGRRLG